MIAYKLGQLAGKHQGILLKLVYAMFLALPLFAVLVGGAGLYQHLTKTPEQVQQEQEAKERIEYAKKSAEAAKQAQIERMNRKGWDVVHASDSFKGTTTVRASLTSTNTQNVGIFSRPVKAEFTVWDKVEPNKYAVRLDFSDSSQPSGRSEYSCHRDCTMQVRIDGGKIESYTLWEAGNGHRSTVFIDSPVLRKKLLEAKTFTIRLQFYSEGYGTFEFSNEKESPFTK